MFWIVLVGCLIFSGCEIHSTDLSSNPSSLKSVTSPEVHPTPPISEKPLRENKSKSTEQTLFGMDSEIEHPVPLPQDVLQILKKDVIVRQTLMKGESAENISASLFLASEITLNEDNLPDLVVTGSLESNIPGANITTFWIFYNTPKGFRLVLRVSTFGLEILKSKVKGFRDIETGGQTAVKSSTDLYVFNGSKYRLRRSSTRLIQ